METWLEDVKRVRIPRPKFGTSSSMTTTPSTRCYPMEPPKDYQLQYDEATAVQLKFGINDLQKATEDLRRAIQEKL